MDSGKMWCFLPIISEKGERYNAKMKGKMVPIWKKYMLTVDEAVQYFGIG